MILKKFTLVIVLFSTSSFSFAMENGDEHPGGLFRKNTNASFEQWAPQCQGCKSFLLSYSVTSEPSKKNVSYEHMQDRMNHVNCSWKPKPVSKDNEEEKK